MGGALFKTGANEAAAAAFRKALELALRGPSNYFNLARVELTLNRYAEVMHLPNKFLPLEPQDAAAHAPLGRAYLNLNKPLLGIQEFQKALAIDDRFPLAHFHLGFAKRSLGNIDAALVEFKKEIEITPGLYDAYRMAAISKLSEAALAKPRLTQGNCD